MITRWLEGISGVLATLLGFVSIAFMVFGPLYNTASDGPGGETRSSTGLLGSHSSSGAFMTIAILIIVLLALGVTAAWDSLHGSLTLRALLLGETTILFVSACVTIASVGILLVPSLIFAIIATIFAFIPRSFTSQQQPTA